MKYFIMILFVIIISSCSMDQMNFFTFDSPRFSSMKEACEWIHKNIDYELSHSDLKDPDQTLNDGTGDCADMAFLLMAIMNYQHLIKSEYVSINTEKGTRHAIVKYDGYYYDCTNGSKSKSYNGSIHHTMEYYRAMEMCYYN